MAIQTEQIDPTYFAAGARDDDFDVIGTPVQRSDALGPRDRPHRVLRGRATRPACCT